MTEVLKFDPVTHPNYKVPTAVYENKVQKLYEKTLEQLGMTAEEAAAATFDPEEHLLYYSGGDFMKHKFNNTRRLSMEELGLVNKLQISDIGVLDPFPLFTDEAILLMKAEILGKEVFMDYAHRTGSQKAGLNCLVRGFRNGMTKHKKSFTEEAWTNPKTMELILKMAGVELEICMDYEIGHTNISLPNSSEENEDIKKAREKATSGATKGEDMPAVVNWHYDSYPFVCVLMISDALKMIGGETSLRMGASDDGTQKVAVVPGPQMGYANVLQGRYIEHIAPQPVGGLERITMVLSYRPKDPTMPEGTFLGTVKPETSIGTIGNIFYPQYLRYRFDLLTKRFDLIKEKLVDGGDFDRENTITQLKEMSEYLKKTWVEMEMTSEHKAKRKELQAVVLEE